MISLAALLRPFIRWSRRAANGFKGRNGANPQAIPCRRCAAVAGPSRLRTMRGRGEAGIEAGINVLPLLVTMSSTLAHAPVPEVRVRKAERGDLDALAALEHRVFATDRLSRRSLQRFLQSPSAEVIVAQDDTGLAGNAIVLFRPRSVIARLYSIAVAPAMSGRGVGAMLLAAAEAAALARGCRAIRLEVHVTNHAAISRYRKSGYREFGRLRRYYEDGGDALRFEKRLASCRRPTAAPPYFHQTTEFTCGPACMMMALAWADRSVRSRRPPRSSSSSGAKPPPSSRVPARAAASPTGWRSRSSAAASRPRSMSAAPARTSSTRSGRPTGAGSCR